MELLSEKTFVITASFRVDLYELGDKLRDYISMYNSYASYVAGSRVEINLTDDEVYSYVRKLVDLFNTNNNMIFSDIIEFLVNQGINTENAFRMSDLMVRSLLAIVGDLIGAPIRLDMGNAEIVVDDQGWMATVIAFASR